MTSETNTPAPSGRTSLWAVASLFASLALFCPLLTLAGPVLGVVALRDRPVTVRTRRLARAGIIIGCVASLGWCGLAVWWHVNVRKPLIDGPRVALRAGLDGDAAAFMSAFVGDGATNDDDARRFLAELADRYGRFNRMSQRPDEATEADAADRAAGAVRVPYSVEFDAGIFDFDGLFRLRTADGTGPALKWGWIALRDDVNGDLVYPSSATSDANRVSAVDPEPEPGQ